VKYVVLPTPNSSLFKKIGLIYVINTANLFKISHRKKFIKLVWKTTLYLTHHVCVDLTQNSL